MDITFVPFDETWFNCSCKWLQDEELRKLIDAHPINAEQQQKWFEQLHQKKDYFIWGVAYLQKPIGVVGLKHVTETTGEYWGYIGEKKFWGKGIGGHMLNHIEQFSREKMLNKIYLKVLAANIRAVKSYQKNQFVIISENKGLLLMEKILSGIEK